MMTQNENQDFVQSDWFDPFPEPHTIPAGWDTSGFFSVPQADAVKENDSDVDIDLVSDSPFNMAKTLFQKIWNSHVVAEQSNSPAVLYIDLHLVHEVTSPQAFDGLRQRGLKVRPRG